MNGENEISSFQPGIEDKSSRGPLIGIIIIILIIILGGIYLLSQRNWSLPGDENNELSTPEESFIPPPTPDSTNSDEEITQVEAGMEAELQAMEADLNSLEQSL